MAGDKMPGVRNDDIGGVEKVRIGVSSDTGHTCTNEL